MNEKLRVNTLTEVTVLEQDEESLDLTEVQFQQLLEKTVELVIAQHAKAEDQIAYPNFTPIEVASWFDEPLPHKGMNTEDLLAFIQKKVLHTATNNLGPHFYAYIISGGNQVSIAAETLANTINQNHAKWHISPAMTEIEKRLISWTAEMINYPKDAGGILVSGGSAANLTGLTVARNIFFEKYEIKKKGLFGMSPFVVYTSEEVHNCVDKSVEQLGIGTNHLRKIKTNQFYQIDTNLLIKQIESDLQNGLQPFCLIGTAGTVNTGAIDELDKLADIAKQYQLWFHVDGAYGGLASSLEHLKPAYKGIERADSVALDYHKWLYQPFEAGCTIVKNWNLLRRTYFNRADYLDSELDVDNGRLEINEHTFQLSRNAKAFKVWMSIKAYGIEQLKRMILKDILLTDYLIEQIQKSTDFEIMAQANLAIACFRFTNHLEEDKAIDDLQQKLIPALEEDGRVFITGTKLKGKKVLRACLINHRKNKKTTDFLLEVIREVGSKL